jgi:hypothetical protein
MTLKNPVIGLNIFDSFFHVDYVVRRRMLMEACKSGKKTRHERPPQGQLWWWVAPPTSSVFLLLPQLPLPRCSPVSLTSDIFTNCGLALSFFFTKYDDYFWDLSLSMSFTWFHLLSWKPAGPNIFSRHDAGTGKEACSLWSCSFYISAPLISYVKL